MSDSLESPNWGFRVFYGMSIVTLPIYFTILICLIHLRCVSKTYKTTFYSLLLQHVRFSKTLFPNTLKFFLKTPRFDHTDLLEENF